MDSKHIDIEQMIMRTRYELSLSQAAAAADGKDHAMEYEKRIKELLDAVSTLLESNNELGGRLSASLEKIEALEAENARLRGELAQRKRSRYGKSSEKSHGGPSNKGKTKEEQEEDYIRNGSKKGVPVEETDEEDDEADEGTSSAASKEYDGSNRPDKYNTMHADICVIHECDLEKLKELGYTYIRPTRPLGQIDRVSLVRQDRYLYVWVRDKDGNEFPFFCPKDGDCGCRLNDGRKYAMPGLVPHTSATASMLADLAVNRYQYAISTGRELCRMANEKMHLCAQTVLNWLGKGGALLKKGQAYLKRLLLKNGTAVYCDETWVDTKVRCKDGKVHYRRRYMWVLVNLATKVCYYHFGRRRRKDIEEFLGDFKGVLMTDAYVAYAYFGRLKDCTHVCCWAHVRRILVSALKDYKDPAAEAFVNLIGLLYKVEVANILLHRTEAEILKARKTESMPVLTELYQKASSLLKEYRRKAARISEKLRQGLEYMLNHWQELAGYVNFGNVLIDNNCCERTVRPFTNLRKNFGGFSSRSGGETTAVYLSFIETCKLRKKGVLDFFREFFGMAASGRTDYEAMSEALLC